MITKLLSQFLRLFVRMQKINSFVFLHNDSDKLRFKFPLQDFLLPSSSGHLEDVVEEEGGDGDGEAEEDGEQQHAAHVDHQELVNVEFQIHHFES